MEYHSFDGVVAETLTLILRAERGHSAVDRHRLPNDPATLAVFSYREDFDYLWGIGPHAGAGYREDSRLTPGEPATLVLVWDGEPRDESDGDSPLDVGSNVTAYDWVVFLTLNSRGPTPTRAVRVFLVDLASGGYPGSFANRVVPELTQALPWLRIYRPGASREGRAEEVLAKLDRGSEDARFVAGFLTPQALGLHRLLSDLGIGDLPLEPPFLSGSDATSLAAESLRDLWISHLTKDCGRHAVSNLIAPFILAEGLLEAGCPGARDVVDRLAGNRLALALIQLLRALGVLSATVEASGCGAPAPVPVSNARLNPFEEAVVEADLLGRFAEGVRLLLVDDQVALGYKEILEAILPERVATVGGPVTLTADPSPAVLVAWLFRATGLDPSGALNDPTPCPTCGGTGPATLVLWDQPRLIGSGDVADGLSEDLPRFDVLLIDLRLFGGPNADWEEEAAHLAALLDFVHRSGLCRTYLMGAHGRSAPLPSSVAAARVRLQSLRSAGPRSPADAGVEYNLLLPLLICLVDPSLPILLFSSTRQRVVVEAFKSWPNVTTRFAKPTISAWGDHQPPLAYIEDLSQALVECFRLHEARAIWAELVRYHDQVSAEPFVAKPAGLKRRGRPSNQLEPLEYSVGPSDIRHLAREYRHKILHDRFADALMVPGNWSEGLNARCENRDTDELDSARLTLVLPRHFDGRGGLDGAGLFGDLSGAPDGRYLLRKVMELYQKQESPSSAKFEKLGRIKNVLGRSDFDFSSEKMAEYRDAACEYLAKNPMPASLSRMVAIDFREALGVEASYMAFAVVQGLRNARAHFHVHSEHDQEVRGMALWCWLWALATCFRTGGHGPIVVGPGPYEAVTSLEFPLVSSGILCGSGQSACCSLLRRLRHVVQINLFAINGDRLKKLVDTLPQP